MGSLDEAALRAELARWGPYAEELAAIDDATVEETTQRAAIVRSTPEGHEGLSAFLEKRKPNWIV